MSIKKGRVALVTGAGQGIGCCIAKALASEGAFVAVCDAVQEKADLVAIDILKTGGQAAAFTLDVGYKDQCEALVSKLIERFGRIDILVNNAAVMSRAFLQDMTEEQWDTVIRTNLKGPFLMAQAVSGIMCKQGYGRIINISDSISRGDYMQANYAASKAGLDALTHTFAIELGKYGITVNSVCPGYIDPPMEDVLTETFKARSEKFVPLKTMGSPADVAEAVAFFAADETGYINGQIMSVDGGMQTGLKGLQ